MSHLVQIAEKLTLIYHCPGDYAPQVKNMTWITEEMDLASWWGEKILMEFWLLFPNDCIFFVFISDLYLLIWIVAVHLFVYLYDYKYAYSVLTHVIAHLHMCVLDFNSW